MVSSAHPTLKSWSLPARMGTEAAKTQTPQMDTIGGFTRKPQNL